VDEHGKRRLVVVIGGKKNDRPPRRRPVGNSKIFASGCCPQGRTLTLPTCKKFRMLRGTGTGVVLCFGVHGHWKCLVQLGVDSLDNSFGALSRGQRLTLRQAETALCLGHENRTQSNVQGISMALTAAMPLELPVDGRQSETALAVARGTARLLHAHGRCVI